MADWFARPVLHVASSRSAGLSEFFVRAHREHARTGYKSSDRGPAGYSREFLPLAAEAVQALMTACHTRTTVAGGFRNPDRPSDFSLSPAKPLRRGKKN